MMRQDQNRIASPTIRYTGATHAYHIRALMDDSNPEMNGPSHLAQWLHRVAEERTAHAYSRLFRYFAPRIRSYGLRHLYSEAQAMELVQNTLLTVWQKAHLYQGEKGAAATWIYTVMRNQCFDMLRRQMASKEQLVAEDLWPVLELQVETDLVADTGENQVLTRQLAQYIHRLPVAQQEVVRGIYLQDLTLQELAERLDVPLGTIKSRLRLALEKLREQIGHADD